MKHSISLNVIYTPEQIRALPGRDLSSHTAVVIDVLRATSVVVTGLANGAEAFYPVATVEEARELKKADPKALLAGERAGDPPEGFDLGNNPLEFTAERVKGKRIYHTTTNGTLAFVACRDCRAIVAGSFLNMGAVVDFLRKQSGPILLVCAGTHEDFALEDALAAGMIADELGVENPVTSIYWSQTEALTDALAISRNGRALYKAGREADVAACSKLNQFTILPELMPDGWIKA